MEAQTKDNQEEVKIEFLPWRDLSRSKKLLAVALIVMLFSSISFFVGYEFGVKYASDFYSSEIERVEKEANMFRDNYVKPNEWTITPEMEKKLDQIISKK